MDKVEARWEHFSHEADVGVRGYGATKAEAFEQAGLALCAVVTDPASVVPRQEVSVRCEAPDDELLFADWLNGLIYEMTTRGLVFGRFDVRFEGQSLIGRAWGEPVDVPRHRPAVEPKGATYTALRVSKENGCWVAQTVVDV